MTKTEEKIEFTIFDIEKCILTAKELQTSRDLCLVFEYKSRNKEFRKAPPSHNVTLPPFGAFEIKIDKLYELLGSLARASNEMKTMVQNVKSKSAMAIPCTRECCS